MIPFALGGLAGYVLTLGAGFLLGWKWIADSPRADILEFALLLVALPAAVQALASDLLARVMKKRAFDPRAGMFLGPIVAGLIASVVAVVATAIALPLVRERAPDSLVISVAAACSACLVVPILPRVRKGLCIRCGYDLAATGDGARCPECGAFGSR